LLLGLLIVLVWQFDFIARALGLLGRLSLVVIAAALVLQLSLWAIQVHVWRETLHAVSGRRIRWRAGLAHLAAVVLGKYLPGKVWGMAARGGALLAEGDDTATVVRATLYEQSMIVATAGLVTLSALLLSSPHVSEYMAVGVSLAGFLILVWLLGPFAALFDRLLRLLSGKRHGSSNPLQKIVGSKTRALLIALQSLAWIVQGLIVLLFAGSLGISIRSSGLEIVGANAAAAVAGFIAIFAPAGIGIREASFVAFLQGAIDIEVLAVVALLVRVWSVLADLMLGFAAVWLGILDRSEWMRGARRRS
jgi:uncharacterized membrane protein YbhN (UPF0104 family)